MEPQRDALSCGNLGWRNRGAEVVRRSKKIGAAGAALEQTLRETSALPWLSAGGRDE
jgi:hypothetical protein